MIFLFKSFRLFLYSLKANDICRVLLQNKYMIVFQYFDVIFACQSAWEYYKAYFIKEAYTNFGLI